MIYLEAWPLVLIKLEVYLCANVGATNLVELNFNGLLSEHTWTFGHVNCGEDHFLIHILPVRLVDLFSGADQKRSCTEGLTSYMDLSMCQVAVHWLLGSSPQAHSFQLIHLACIIHG